jgi:hypothetical protein
MGTKTLRNESAEPVTISTIRTNGPNVGFGAVGADPVIDPGSELMLTLVRIGSALRG